MPLSCTDKNPLQNSWFRIVIYISTKMERFVGTGTSHPSKKLYKNSSKTSVVISKIRIIPPTSEVKFRLKSPPRASWSGSAPKSNQLVIVTHPTTPKIRPTRFWVIVLTDKHTKAKRNSLDRCNYSNWIPLLRRSVRLSISQVEP